MTERDTPTFEDLLAALDSGREANVTTASEPMSVASSGRGIAAITGIASLAAIAFCAFLISTLWDGPR